MNKRKQVTSIAVATAFTLTTVVNAVPAVVYAHEVDKQIELDMYGDTSADTVIDNNTEDKLVNDETIPEMESIATGNTIDLTSSNTIWNDEKLPVLNLQTSKTTSSSVTLDDGNTSADTVINNNTEDTSVNEETKPEIESVINDNLDNAVEIISSNTTETISSDKTWDVEKTLSGDLVVNQGVTLTIDAKVTISGNVTISGGGTIKRGDFTGHLISVPEGSSLTLENITLDGGAEYSGETNSLLNRGTENIGITAEGALVYSSGRLTINEGTNLQNNFWKSASSGSAAVYVAKGTTTMNGGAICNNYGGRFGAGVYVHSNTEFNLNGGTISYNHCDVGGGISPRGKMTMKGGDISYNYAKAGGAIRGLEGGNIKITGGEIHNNQSYGQGGGIYTYNSILEVSGGKIYKNESKSTGGAIDASGKSLTITGGKIYENKSESNGGGIHVSGANVYLLNGTIEKNSISNGKGGGVYIHNHYNFTLGNVIIKGNELINSDNSTRDDIAINYQSDKVDDVKWVCLSRTDYSDELHFSFLGNPIAFKSLDGKPLSTNILKKIIYEPNSGEKNYQMWFNSNDGKIYSTKIVTNGGQFPYTTTYVGYKLAEPIKNHHIFRGWYDDELFTGSQLTTQPETEKTYYAKWEESSYKVDDEVNFELRYKNIEAKDFTVSVNNGTPTISSVISSNDNVFTAKVDDTNKAKIVVTPASNLNIGTHKETLTVTTGDNATHFVTVRLKVNKAIPTYTAPSNLTAVYGQTLSDVKLPDGFSWQDSDTTSVGNVGKNTFKAIYTPKDTENYDTISDIEIVLLVNPKMQLLNKVPTITAQDKTLTVGNTFDPLNGVTANDEEDGEIKDIEVISNNVDVTQPGIYTVTYKVTDSQGASVTKTITVTVKAKAKKPKKQNDNEKIDYNTNNNSIASQIITNNEKIDYNMNNNSIASQIITNSDDSKKIILADGTVATGWNKVNEKWYLSDANGVVEKGWVNNDSEWYYFNDNGEMQTEWIKDADNKWYYCGADGAMKTGWLKDTDGAWYHLNNSGEMSTGWIKDINNKWYYLDNSGKMRTGWIKLDNKWYYLYSDGSMAENTIINGYLIGNDGSWINN